MKDQLAELQNDDTLYAAYGGVMGVVLLSLGLYLIFAAPKGYFDIGAFLETTSPYSWALTGIGLNIGLSTIGAGWCVFKATARIEALLQTRRERERGGPGSEGHLWRLMLVVLSSSSSGVFLSPAARY